MGRSIPAMADDLGEIMVKRRAGGIAVLPAVLVAVLAGCSQGSETSGVQTSSQPSYEYDGGVGGPIAEPDSFAPAAFGENGQCYYVDDPSEAAALQADGSCPVQWQPAPMPLAWHQRYYPYYDSQAYTLMYVLSTRRSSYTDTEAQFGTRYRSAIVAAAPSAVYRSSSGRQVTCDQVDPAHFTTSSGLSGPHSGGLSGGATSGGSHSVSGGSETGGSHGGTSSGGSHSTSGGTSVGSHSTRGGSSGGHGGHK